MNQATNFRAVHGLQMVAPQAPKKAWELCCTNGYFGPLDAVADDASSSILVESFPSKTSLLHNRTGAVPVESVNFMAIVERYHRPIRR